MTTYNRVKRVPGRAYREIAGAVPPIGVPYLYRLAAYNNWTKNPFRCRPDPFKIAFISPTEIAQNSGERFSYGDLRRDVGLVATGDWDMTGGPFWESTAWDATARETVPQAFKLRFVHGVPWEGTPFFERLFHLADRGNLDWHRCRTRKDLENRCASLDALFDDIEQHGYKSRSAALRAGRHDGMRSVPRFNPRRFEYLMDEIVVNVGRVGDLLFVGGQHRLSIAKIIGVPRIPVRIFVRHWEWQRARDRLFLGHLSLKDVNLDRDHVDLDDVACAAL